MGQFPPSFFQDPDAFQQPEVERMLEEEEHEQHGDHEHGPGCGHEAVEVPAQEPESGEPCDPGPP